MCLSENRLETFRKGVFSYILIWVTQSILCDYKSLFPVTKPKHYTISPLHHQIPRLSSQTLALCCFISWASPTHSLPHLPGTRGQILDWFMSKNSSGGCGELVENASRWTVMSQQIESKNRALLVRPQV